MIKPPKMSFWEYIYFRNFHPILEMLLAIGLMIVVICLSPILVPWLAYTGWKAQYDDYLDWFNKEKD